MKYFKVCVTCGKDYEIEADPKTEQEYKNIQGQVGKKGGLCPTCTNTNYYDDGCMELKSRLKFVKSDFQYISPADLKTEIDDAEWLAALERRHRRRVAAWMSMYGGKK